MSIDTLIQKARDDRFGYACAKITCGAYIECRISESGQARLQGPGRGQNSRAKIEAYLVRTGFTFV